MNEKYGEKVRKFGFKVFASSGMWNSKTMVWGPEGYGAEPLYMCFEGGLGNCLLLPTQSLIVSFSFFEAQHPQLKLGMTMLSLQSFYGN